MDSYFINTLQNVNQIQGVSSPRNTIPTRIQVTCNVIVLQNHQAMRDISAVFSKTIGNLLRTRKHLALMLDREWGNISQEIFDREEEKYLLEIEHRPPDSIIKEVSLLLNLSGLPLDSEEISGMLNCSIDDAEKAIGVYCHHSIKSTQSISTNDVFSDKG